MLGEVVNGSADIAYSRTTTERKAFKPRFVIDELGAYGLDVSIWCTVYIDTRHSLEKSIPR